MLLLPLSIIMVGYSLLVYHFRTQYLIKKQVSFLLSHALQYFINVCTNLEISRPERVIEIVWSSWDLLCLKK